jgi:hypothetical protein
MSKQNECPHCHQPTLVTITTGWDPSGHCTNRACNGYFVTLPLSQFRALTPAQLAAYQGGHQQLASLEADQVAFEAKLDALMGQIAARQAARTAGQQLFG